MWNCTGDVILWVNKRNNTKYFLGRRTLFAPDWCVFTPIWAQKLVTFVLIICYEGFSKKLEVDGTLWGNKSYDSKFFGKKYWTHKLAFYVFGFCSKDFPEFLQDDRTLRRTRKNKSRCKIHVSSLAGIFSVFLPFGKQCILVGTVITFISQLLNKDMLTFSWFWFKSNHSGIIISRWKACLTL